MSTQTTTPDAPSPEFQQTVAEILQLALTTPKARADIFVNYSGHIRGFDVDCHDNGWTPNGKPDARWMFQNGDDTGAVTALRELGERIARIDDSADAQTKKMMDRVKELRADAERIEREAGLVAA